MRKLLIKLLCVGIKYEIKMLITNEVRWKEYSNDYKLYLSDIDKIFEQEAKNE